MFLEGGVSKSTAANYRPHVARWRAFAETSGFDHLLRDMEDMDIKLRVIEFIRGYEGDATRAMTAVRWHLTIHALSTAMLDDPAIRYAKRSAGDRRSSGRERSVNVGRRRRIPIPFEMLPWMRERMWDAGIDDRMAYLGVAIAFTYLLRASSYAISSPDYNHALRSDDVVFVMLDGVKMFAWEVSEGSGVYTAEDVRSVILSFHTDKTHQAGFVRDEVLARLTPPEVQLIEDMFVWAQGSGAQQDQEFLSRWQMYRGQRRHKKLTRHMVSVSLKSAATALGLPADRMSSHSARIGGATELSLAGFQDEVIKVIGCWDGRSSLIYQQTMESTPNPLRVGHAGQGTSLDAIRSAQRPPPRQQQPTVSTIVSSSTSSSRDIRGQSRRRQRSSSPAEESDGDEDDRSKSSTASSTSSRYQTGGGLRFVSFD